LVQDSQIISLRMIRILTGNEAENRVADFAVVDSLPSSQDKYTPQGHVILASDLVGDIQKLSRIT
jgi:hypothetical protein